MKIKEMLPYLVAAAAKIATPSDGKVVHLHDEFSARATIAASVKDEEKKPATPSPQLPPHRTAPIVKEKLNTGVTYLREQGRRALDGDFTAASFLHSFYSNKMGQVCASEDEETARPAACRNLLKTFLFQIGITEQQWITIERAYDVKLSHNLLNDTDAFERFLVEQAAGGEYFLGSAGVDDDREILTMLQFSNILHRLAEQYDSTKNLYDPTFLSMLGLDQSELRDLVAEYYGALNGSDTISIENVALLPWIKEQYGVGEEP